MLFDVLLLSIIEGITEFLPVSSTGHLIIFGSLLNVEPTFLQSFSIIIQFGAIMAVFSVERSYFQSAIRDIFRKKNQVLLVAICPLLFFGFIFQDKIKQLMVPSVIFLGLIVGGIMLVMVDWLIKNPVRESLTPSISIRQALGIGFWQCLSLWPGMSRSAMTVMGGIFVGLERRQATSFSFVLAVPLMGIIASYELFQLCWASNVSMAWVELMWVLVGVLISYMVAVLTMKWFLRMVVYRGLLLFGLYRIVLGCVGLSFFL